MDIFSKIKFRIRCSGCFPRPDSLAGLLFTGFPQEEMLSKQSEPSLVIEVVTSKYKQMREFWDERYQVDEYVYGKAPNTFFKTQLDQLTPGNILLPGEGEGRNAVYAAGKGWNVTAFDTSIEGRKKSLRLAAEMGVTIEYDLLPYLGFNQPDKRFDAVGLFFTHQPSEMRRQFHKNLQKMLRPGGVVLLEAFHKDQISRDTGGPKNIDFLFDETALTEDFSDLEILQLKTLTKLLDEGPFHQGEAEVVQMVAQRRLSTVQP
jgi:SAM-dependent methyltransferase